MNVFIAEDNLQDYLYLRRIVEKWADLRNEPVKIYYQKELYYQLNRYISVCDVAFIDIHISPVDGISFCTYLRKYNQHIEIVLQSHSYHYGIESYRLKALDYLSKPVGKEDIYRLLDVVNIKDHHCLIYKKQRTINKIKFENILFIQVKKHCCYIHCINHIESFYSSLEKVKPLLDQRFLQCYRSYIVNIDYIKIIAKDKIVLINNMHIPLSSGYYETLKQRFTEQK